MLNHQHLLVRAYVHKPPKTRKRLNRWLSELVSDIGMQILMKPRSLYLNEPGNRGITGLVGLTTSHASFHCWDEVKPALCQFDLYSCKDFSLEVIVEKLNEFEVESGTYRLVDRNSHHLLTKRGYLFSIKS